MSEWGLSGCGLPHHRTPYFNMEICGCGLIVMVL